MNKLNERSTMIYGCTKLMFHYFLFEFNFCNWVFGNRIGLNDRWWCRIIIIIWNLMNFFRLKDFVWIESIDFPNVSAHWIDETRLNLIEIYAKVQTENKRNKKEKKHLNFPLPSGTQIRFIIIWFLYLNLTLKDLESETYPKTNFIRI